MVRCLVAFFSFVLYNYISANITKSRCYLTMKIYALSVSVSVKQLSDFLWIFVCMCICQQQVHPTHGYNFISPSPFTVLGRVTVGLFFLFCNSQSVIVSLCKSFRGYRCVVVFDSLSLRLKRRENIPIPLHCFKARVCQSSEWLLICDEMWVILFNDMCLV